MAASQVNARDPVAPVAAEQRPFLYRRSGAWTVRIITAAVLFTSWQLYADGKPLAVNAAPSKIVSAIYGEFAHGVIWGPLASSAEALFLGFLIAGAVGIPVGIAMGRWRPVEYVLDPYVSFFYALPHVVFIPLMVVWFGFELKFRLLYVLVSAVWPFIINTMAGVRNVDPELLATGRSYCATERQTLRTIILPSASPYIVAGARQAFGLSWVAVVVSEILSTQTGLGGLLTHLGQQFRTDQMFVPVVVIMVIGITIQSGTAWLQRRLTPWSQRDV